MEMKRLQLRPVTYFLSGIILYASVLLSSSYDVLGLNKDGFILIFFEALSVFFGVLYIASYTWKQKLYDIEMSKIAEISRISVRIRLTYIFLFVSTALIIFCYLTRKSGMAEFPPSWINSIYLIDATVSLLCLLALVNFEFSLRKAVQVAVNENR